MTPTTVDLATPPYRGPVSFTRGQTLFGRDREARELSGMLISERIILLYSPSGAGKTSLLQAKVIPELERRAFRVIDDLRVSRSLPTASGNRYLDSIITSLRSEEGGSALPAGSSFDALLASLESGEEMQDLVLIFDQFEEILTLDPTDLPAKRAFFQEVGRALLKRNRWALFAMREDYVAALDPYLRFIPTRLSATFRLDLLGERAAAEAIKGPAGACGVTFEPAAVQRLVDDLRLVQVQGVDGKVQDQPGPYVEPVQLQVVCLRLWREWFARRDPDSFTIAEADLGLAEEEGGLGASGSVDVALRAYYDECVAQVAAAPPGELEQAPQVRLARERRIRDFFDGHLITADDIRGQVLQSYQETENLANADIRALVDAYLVRSERRGGRTWYELAHDRLIRPVRASNAAWKGDNLVLAQTRSVVWDDQGRPKGLLLRGDELFAAEEWAAREGVVILDLEREFLEACRVLSRDEERERRRNQLIQTLAVVASTVAVIALGLAFLATVARNEATARLLTAQAARDLPVSPARSLLLAAEATRATPLRGTLPETVSALYDGLAVTGGTAMPGAGTNVYAVALSPDGGRLAAGGFRSGVRVWDTATPELPPAVLIAQALVTDLAFSPDGRMLAATNGDRVLLWPADDVAADPRVLAGHAQPVSALAFSPDGALLASGGADGEVRLWRVADGSDAGILRGHNDDVIALAFTADGRALVSAAHDGTARLWQPGRPESPGRALEGHAGRLTALAVSPDGALVATGGEDAAVRIWPTAGGEPTVLQAHLGAVAALAFSPDGLRLASAGDDGTALLWDVPFEGVAPAPLRAHVGGIQALSFTADGTTLITAGRDQSVRLWRVDSPELPEVVLRAHEASVDALAYSASAGLLASGGNDGSVRLWRLDDPLPVGVLRGAAATPRVLSPGPDGSLLAVTTAAGVLQSERAGAALTVLQEPLDGADAVALSADGRLLAASDFDLRLLVWDLTRPGEEPRVLGEGQLAAFALAFSPDGRQLAAAFEDGSVRLLAAGAPADQGQELRPAGEEQLFTLAFSPDGRRLAGGLTDGQVLLWNLEGAGDGPVVLAGHRSPVTAVAFSADGATMASGGQDRTVRLWSVTQPGRTPVELRGHERTVRSIAFSADGATLAAGAEDATVRLWEINRPTAPPLVLRGHAGAVQGLAFSPDGAWLFSGGDDWIVRRWPLSRADLVGLACAAAGRNLSRAEWGAVFEREAYRRTCAGLPASPSLVREAARLVADGQIEEAAALTRRVEQLGAADEIPGLEWAELCRAWALAGQPRLADCDRGVALARGDGRANDSRGIARAVAGDLAGARDDFAAYLVWGEANAAPTNITSLRQEWNAAIDAGRNPFDEDTLLALQAESS